MTISQNVAARGGSPNTIARFTETAFGSRSAIADDACAEIRAGRAVLVFGPDQVGRLSELSFGAKTLFAEEFKLHIFGAEIPYPAPELMATLSGVAEVTFPVMLVLGFGARYAALGLLGMTAIIQLTVPDGWANFHLPWAAMALAIMTFGPGKIALDYVLGLDWSLRAD